MKTINKKYMIFYKYLQYLHCVNHKLLVVALVIVQRILTAEGKFFKKID